MNRASRSAPTQTVKPGPSSSSLGSVGAAVPGWATPGNVGASLGNVGATVGGNMLAISVYLGSVASVASRVAGAFTEHVEITKYVFACSLALLTAMANALHVRHTSMI